MFSLHELIDTSHPVLSVFDRNIENYNILIENNLFEKMSRGGKTKISEMDKKYFREIFLLHAKDDKITYQGL